MRIPPVKNLLSRVQEPPDPITRVQVGLHVEGHVLSPSLSLLTSYFQLFPSSTLAILLFNVTNNKVKLNQLSFTSARLVIFSFVQRWIFSDAVMPSTSRTFRPLVRNLKGGINSDWQDTRKFPINTEYKNCHQQESKNYTTFFPHAFRAKGDSMCHVYSVEDCVKAGAPRSFIQITIHVTWHQVTRLF